MAKMTGMKAKAYAMGEKKESPAMKKKEMKAGMHLMKGKAMKNSSMKKMGKKK